MVGCFSVVKCGFVGGDAGRSSERTTGNKKDVG